MTLLSQLAALAAIVGTGVVYGTDVFCALVQRPALARVDDATLTAVMGNVHRSADRRMPAPGILGCRRGRRSRRPRRSSRPDRGIGDGGSGVPPLGGLAGPLPTHQCADQPHSHRGCRRPPDAVERPRAAARLGPNHRPQSRPAGSRRRRAVRKPDQLTYSTHTASRQSSAGSRTKPGSASLSARTRCGTRSSRPSSTPECHCATSKRPIPTPTRGPP